MTAVAVNTPLIDLSQEWDDGGAGETFDLVRGVVTLTSAQPGSKFLSFSLSGASGDQFHVTTDGDIFGGSMELLYNLSAHVGIVNTMLANSPGNAVITEEQTVAQLPTVAGGWLTAGGRAFVKDSTVAYTSANLGKVVVGGGAKKVPVYFDGTGWRIG